MTLFPPVGPARSLAHTHISPSRSPSDLQRLIIYDLRGPPSPPASSVNRNVPRISTQAKTVQQRSAGPRHENDTLPGFLSLQEEDVAVGRHDLSSATSSARLPRFRRVSFGPLSSLQSSLIPHRSFSKTHVLTATINPRIHALGPALMGDVILRPCVINVQDTKRGSMGIIWSSGWYVGTALTGVEYHLVRRLYCPLIVLNGSCTR